MIIFGTRGITSTTKTGEFHCPRCGPQRPYAWRRVNRWFTLYFIPVIPMGMAGEYIECQQCAGTFGTEVLTYDPAAEQQKTLEEVERILVLVTLAAGHPTETKVTNLQQAILELTGIHVAPEELWNQFRMAQSANAQMVPYVQRVAQGFSDDGKRKLMSGACFIVSRPGPLTQADEETLRQLGSALGLQRSAVNQFLEQVKNVS
jgi:hypothetical protein